MSEYDDILYAPRFEPKHHPRMPLSKRAAQFAPFDALTGFDELLVETERDTEERKELSEDALEELNRKFMQVMEENSRVSIRYFEKDDKKAGGKYRTAFGFIKDIDLVRKRVIMEEGRHISFHNILSVEEV